MLAAGGGHIDALRALAVLGVNMAATDQQGGTALAWAAMAGHINALRALLELGGGLATVSAIRVARRDAQTMGKPACVRWLDRCVGWTPFHRACDARRGVQPLVAMLRAGADPARLAGPEGEKMTPLGLCRLADPAEGALPEDASMSELVAEAVLPWRINRHHLFPHAFVPRLVVLLLVQQRLERQAADFALEQLAQPLAPHLLSQQRRLVALQLTRELWLALAPFLPRFGSNGAAA